MLTNFGAMQSSSFQIAFDWGPGFINNLQAQAAIRRGADQWARRINSKASILLRFDTDPALGPGRGSASTSYLQVTYPVFRNALISAQAAETGDATTRMIPEQLQQIRADGTRTVTDVFLTKSNAKALGFQNVDAMIGGPDATITFSPSGYDFDNSDGVTPGMADLESGTAHEVGHALGFTSAMDGLNPQPLPTVAAVALDVFRFESGTPNDPATVQQFATFPRSLRPGQAVNFDVISRALPLATGLAGDGTQAGHWKQNVPPQLPIGTMVGLFNTLALNPVVENDLRAIDAIGYDVSFPDDPRPPSDGISRVAINKLIVDP
jgi:hypothetical protein